MKLLCFDLLERQVEIVKKPNLFLDLLTIACLILIAAIFILSVILINYDMAVAAVIGLALGIYVLQFRRDGK